MKYIEYSKALVDFTNRPRVRKYQLSKEVLANESAFTLTFARSLVSEPLSDFDFTDNGNPITDNFISFNLKLPSVT